MKASSPFAREEANEKKKTERLFHLVLESLAGSENGDLLRRDLDDFLGILGVPAFTGSSFTDFKRSEANKLNLFTLGKGAFDGFENRSDGSAGSLFVQPCRLCNLSYEFCFGHLLQPPLD